MGNGRGGEMMIYLVIILYVLGARISVAAVELGVKYSEKTLEDDVSRAINYSATRYGITIFKVITAIFWPFMALSMILKLAK